MNNKFEDKICDAMDVMIGDAIKKMDFDKTVQGRIVSCVDATIGKYKVAYQDSFFYAYSNVLNSHFSEGTRVYISIPNGDMSQRKAIIGTVEEKGSDYITNVEKKNRYQELGTNVFLMKETGEFNLSHITEEERIYPSEGNKILDDSNFRNKRCDSFKIQADITTKIPEEYQIKGNYGIKIIMEFKNNTTKDSIDRTFIMDVPTMTGNPYQYTVPTTQYEMFSIDGASFEQIKEISLFSKGFVDSEEIEKEKTIKIENIQIVPCDGLTQEELNGYKVILEYPEGNIFRAGGAEKLPIAASVLIKGREVDFNSQKIDFYWFRENASVGLKSEQYNQIGGIGWECLNKSFIYSISTETGKIEQKVGWTATGNNFEINKSYCIDKITHLKCVIQQDSKTHAEYFDLINESGNEFIITSSKGTEFNYDYGRPDLILQSSIPLDNCTYHWIQVNPGDKGVILPEDENRHDALEYNKTQLDQALIKYNTGKCEDDLAAGQAEILKYTNSIEDLEKEAIVYHNRIDKLLISDIENEAIFKCSVLDNEKKLIGTGSILLKNSLKNQDNYNLYINNNIKLIQYDKTGKEPNIIYNNFDQKESVLTFDFSSFNEKIYYEEEKSKQDFEICWKVPIQNTLIQLPIDLEKQESLDKKYYYINTAKLPIRFKESYVPNADNTILLDIKYRGQFFAAHTDFMVMKEGSWSSRIDKFTGRIIPRVKSNDPNKEKILSKEFIPQYRVKVNPDGTIAHIDQQWNFSTWVDEHYPNAGPFEFELFKNNKLIFKAPTLYKSEGADPEGEIKIKFSEENIEEENICIVKMKWSILKNTYSDNFKGNDSPLWYVGPETGTLDPIGLIGEIVRPSDFSMILQCQLDYQLYIGDKIDNEIHSVIASIPISVCAYYLDKNSEVNNFQFLRYLELESGFYDVLYNKAGFNPEYENKVSFKAKLFREDINPDPNHILPEEKYPPQQVLFNPIFNTKLVSNIEWEIDGYIPEIPKEEILPIKTVYKNINETTLLDNYLYGDESSGLEGYRYNGSEVEKLDFPVFKVAPTEGHLRGKIYSGVLTNGSKKDFILNEIALYDYYIAYGAAAEKNVFWRAELDATGLKRQWVKYEKGFDEWLDKIPLVVRDLDSIQILIDNHLVTEGDIFLVRPNITLWQKKKNSNERIKKRIFKNAEYKGRIFDGSEIESPIIETFTPTEEEIIKENAIYKHNDYYLLNYQTKLDNNKNKTEEHLVCYNEIYHQNNFKMPMILSKDIIENKKYIYGGLFPDDDQEEIKLLDNNKVYYSKKLNIMMIQKDGVWIPDENLPFPNEFFLSPSDKYSGLCVSNKIICRCKIENDVVELTVPIYLHQSTEEFSQIQNWNGNSLTLDSEKGGLALSPQAGVCYIDSIESTSLEKSRSTQENKEVISGIFFGDIIDTNLNNKTLNYNQGLFGYHEGERTLFLDAKTGRSVFGSEKKGQIILDPNDDAKIHGGTEEGKSEWNLTKGYLSLNQNNGIGHGNNGVYLGAAGLSIIGEKGAAQINADGSATFSGTEFEGSSLGGWKVQTDYLESLNQENISEKVILDSGDSSLYSGSYNSKKGWQLKGDGTAIFEKNIYLKGDTYFGKDDTPINIPQLSSKIDKNSKNITTINDTTIPQLSSKIDKNSKNITTINDTTIPQLSNKIDENSKKLNGTGDVIFQNTYFTGATYFDNTPIDIPQLSNKVGENTTRINNLPAKNIRVEDEQGQVQDKLNGIVDLGNGQTLNFIEGICVVKNSENINKKYTGEIDLGTDQKLKFIEGFCVGLI